MSVRPHPLQGEDPRYSQTWIIDYRLANGKRRQQLFDGTEAEARKLEHSLRLRNKTPGKHLFPSLLEVVHLFQNDYQTDHQPRGYERLQYSLKQILPFFGRYQFQSISIQLVEQYKRKRLADGVKPTTINKELAALSSLCKWAEDQGYCDSVRIKRFPNKLTKAPAMDPPTRKEVVKLLRAIHRTKRPVFALMYYLGLRSQEARDLQPEAVRLDRGVVLVTGKGNKQRIVPIGRKAKPYLRHSVPCYAPKDFREILEFACKRAGLRYINPHLLRHAFGCHMTAAGVGLRALQEIMGHSSPVITERYSQVVAETLKKEMEKF